MALGLSLLPKKSMITFRLLSTNIFLRLWLLPVYVPSPPTRSSHNNRSSSCLVVSQPTPLTPMWFHTHLETNPRASRPTQTHHHLHHGPANETWARDVSPLTSMPDPARRANVSPPSVRRTCPRPSSPAVSAQSPASCIRSDQRFVPRGRVCPQLGRGSLTSHIACGSGMASLGELG